MGFNIAKKMWKDSATIRLSIDDPFNLNVVSSRLDYNGVARYSTSKWNTQRMALGFTYKFGSMGDNTPRKNDTEEAARM